MKRLIFIFLWSLTISALAQTQTPEFSFQLYFEDAVGHKDTLTLGYDPLATDSIDTAFGEVNILNQSMDTSVLNVYISNIWIKKFAQGDSTGMFRLKKQIIPYSCNNYYSGIINIEVFTHYWPITLTDNDNQAQQLFSDSCRLGSVFTSINPGGWWDVGSPSNLGRWILSYPELSQGGQVIFPAVKTFTPNYCVSCPIDSHNSYGYSNNEGEGYSLFWFAFANEKSLSVGLEKNNLSKNRVIISPNPFENSFVMKSDQPIDGVQIYDLQGRSILYQKKGKTIFIDDCHRGIYLIRTQIDNKYYVSKIIKK